MKSFRTSVSRRNDLRSRAHGKRSAFTLLELLIVLAIIVALAAMVAPNLISSQQDANISTTRTTIRHIEDAFKRKAVKNNGNFDTTTGSEAIRALADSWQDSLGQQQAPLLEEIPRDAWNHEFQYAFDPNSDVKPRIWSLGPNGEDEGGQGDDVSNLRRDQE
ncbi:MAG: type II secretion system protein GspG [Planctomycetaceae bacterium]|nr:type II secretion system protein GspG [Planctomycetaceae bacterium]